MPAKKTGSSKKTSSSGKARAKVGKVMHEYKRGQLKSGGRSKVKNPKQAIAIGLSEARRAGANIPAKAKSAAKKKSPSKSASRKTAAKRSSASEKTAAKKSPARKKR